MCDAPTIAKSPMFVSHLRRQGIVTSVVWAACPPSGGRALNGTNSASGGIATGGWALHLQECPRCCHPLNTQTQTHTNTHSCMLREAQQEQLAKKKKKGGESQWHCLRSTMNILLFDSADVDAHTHTHTAARMVPIKTGTHALVWSC